MKLLTRLRLALALLLGLWTLLACNPPPALERPVIQSFTADPSTIDAGGSSTLSWEVEGADGLTLEPGGLDVSGEASTVVSPLVTTSYTLSATNAAGSSEKSVTVTVRASGDSSSKAVRAAEGGTLEAGGAALTIPPGALNQDTLVTLLVSAPPGEPAENPMQPAGPRVGLDLGGAKLGAAAALTLPYEPEAEMVYVVTETSAENAAGGNAATRVHAATPQGEGAVVLAIERAGAYGVYGLPSVDASQGLGSAAEGLGNTSLQVPFYWQAGYPWCSPTSTAMYLNYFQPQPEFASSPEAPGGRVSNYYLASLLKQDATSGSWVGSFFEAAKVPSDRYSWLRWDADLIPSAPFVSYIVLATTGAFGLGPMRPVLTTSDQISHAFVITGLSADGIFINDGNARWSGTHPSMTWAQFRSQNAIGTQNDELGTLFLMADPRPEAERRGSIELAPPTGESMSRTIRFENPSGRLISSWTWDANPFPYGYYFDDATKQGLWPIDATFGRVLPRSSALEVNFNVVNITENDLAYDVTARLYVAGDFKLERSALGVAVSAYDRERIDLDFGNLASVLGAIGAPVTGRVEINLTQGGVVQDVKAVSFKLGPDPSDAPYVTIRNAGSGVTTLKGVPITLAATAYDRYALPDGEVPAARLVWREGGAAVGTGLELTRAFASTGQRTLTLTATGEYGATASASIQVNVIDPARNPGEVVIDYPANDTTIAFTTFGTIAINLVGHATYADGTAVPEDRLFWTREGGSAIGTGSSTVVELPGYCSTHSYTISLTARKLDGSPIGTTSVKITLVGPPC